MSYICSHCHRLIEEDELITVNYPATWDEYDGGSPEEWCICCPTCREEIDSDDVVGECEVCGEPLYIEKTILCGSAKGPRKRIEYYHTEKPICQECQREIGKLLNNLAEEYAAEHGVTPEKAKDLFLGEL